MQETLAPPVETQPSRHRTLRGLGGFGLHRTFERPAEIINNDPLAPLYLLHESASFEAAEPRIRAEFTTDLSERAHEKHFYKQVDYRIEGDDLIAQIDGQDNQSLSEILDNGLKAAYRDGNVYGVERAEALCAHREKILKWHREKSSGQLLLSSLCPDASEVPTEEAKALYFKPDRMMSSNWLIEKTAGGIRMHVFSLDNHTLNNHHELLVSMMLGGAAGSSLQELNNEHYLWCENGEEAVHRIQSAFDSILDYSGHKGSYFGIEGAATQASANELIAGRPEAYELYVEAIQASYKALVCGRVTRRFSRLLKDLRAGFGGFEAPVSVLNKRLFRGLDATDVTELVDYLRCQAIPHFFYGTDASSSISTSGAAATARGLTYEGSCPTSPGTLERRVADQRSLLEAMYFGRPLFASRLDTKTCPCCLPTPRAGETVNAWKTDTTYGCDDCGHVVDICIGVVKQGNPNARKRREVEKRFSSRGKSVKPTFSQRHGSKSRTVIKK